MGPGQDSLGWTQWSSCGVCGEKQNRKRWCYKKSKKKGRRKRKRRGAGKSCSNEIL